MTREDGTTHTTLEPIINAGTRAIPTAISVPYICPNPAAAFFQIVSCFMKGQQISNTQYAQAVNILYIMIYESKSDQNKTYSLN